MVGLAKICGRDCLWVKARNAPGIEATMSIRVGNLDEWMIVMGEVKLK